MKTVGVEEDGEEVRVRTEEELLHHFLWLFLLYVKWEREESEGRKKILQLDIVYTYTMREGGVLICQKEIQKEYLNRKEWGE